MADRVHDVVAEVLAELERAGLKFPTWPTDPIHAVTVVAEESGELQRAVLQAVYEPHKGSLEDARIEAVQTAAMAIRFALGVPHYVPVASEQHLQDLG